MPRYTVTCSVQGGLTLTAERFLDAVTSALKQLGLGDIQATQGVQIFVTEHSDEEAE